MKTWHVIAGLAAVGAAGVGAYLYIDHRLSEKDTGESVFTGACLEAYRKATPDQRASVDAALQMAQTRRSYGDRMGATAQLTQAASVLGAQPGLANCLLAQAHRVD